jgi:hypothetical protein
MKRKVYIAVPAVDGTNNVSLTHFLCAAERNSFDAKCPWAFEKAFYVGYKPVAFMRNAIFGDFLKSDCERLWMLDADIVPPPRAFEMLDVQDDIVAGGMPGYKAGANGNGIVLQVLAYDQRESGEWDSIYRVPLETWGATKITGDLDFCERARARGYTITLWPDQMFGQHESLDLLDVAAYGARCASTATVGDELR